MSYVPFNDTRTAAQRVADRKADELWAETHKPVYDAPSVPTTGVYYRPTVDAAFSVASAH